MLTDNGRRPNLLGRRTLLLAVLLLALTRAAPGFRPSAAFAIDNGCETSTPNAGDMSTDPDPETESETIDEAMEGPPTVSGAELAALRAGFNNVTRPNFWKNEAAANPGAYSPSDLARMQNGSPPIGVDGYPVELHHIVPLSRGGTNDPSNLLPMTRTAHRLGKNFRLNHPAQGCPDPEPKSQTTSGNGGYISRVQEDPSRTTDHQFCFGDGTPCSGGTIPRGGGTVTFSISHPFGVVGAYTQRATITQSGTFSEVTTTRAQPC